MNGYAGPLLEAELAAGCGGLRHIEIDVPVGRKLVHHKLCAFGIAACGIAVSHDVGVAKVDEAVSVERGARSPGIVDFVGQLGILIKRNSLPRIGGVRRRR
jgi:hypothetical protein